MINNWMQTVRNIKNLIVSISLLAAILTGQSSIEVPVGASITIPTDAYICAGTITVNGTVTYTGSSLCVVPNAHLIASILETSALNEAGGQRMILTVSKIYSTVLWLFL